MTLKDDFFARFVSGTWCGALIIYAIARARPGSDFHDCEKSRWGPYENDAKTCAELPWIIFDMCHMTNVMLAFQLMAHAGLVFCADPRNTRLVTYCAVPLLVPTLFVLDRGSDAKDPWLEACEDTFSSDEGGCGIAILVLRIVALCGYLCLAVYSLRSDCFPDGGQSNAEALFLAQCSLGLFAIATIFSVCVYFCFYFVLYVDASVLLTYFGKPELAPPNTTNSSRDDYWVPMPDSHYGTCSAGSVLFFNQVIHVLPMLINLLVLGLTQNSNRTVIGELKGSASLRILWSAFGIAVSIAIIYVFAFPPWKYYSSELGERSNPLWLFCVVIVASTISMCALWYGFGEKGTLACATLTALTACLCANRRQGSNHDDYVF